MRLSPTQRECLRRLADVAWSTPTIGFSIEVGGWTFKSTTADKLEGLGLVEKALDWSRGPTLVTRRWRITEAGKALIAAPMPDWA